MSITATELKSNLGKYLMLAETEDIYITRNGKVVAKLSNPYQERPFFPPSRIDASSRASSKVISAERTPNNDLATSTLS